MARKSLGRFKKILCDNGESNCHYCNTNLVFGGKQRGPDFATVDHMTAYAKGGKNSLNNFVLCCMRCNSLKGHMDYNDYVKIVKNKDDRDRMFYSIKKTSKENKNRRHLETVIKMATFFHVTGLKIVE